jgi:hypothetical protein
MILRGMHWNEQNWSMCMRDVDAEMDVDAELRAGQQVTGDQLCGPNDL